MYNSKHFDLISKNIDNLIDKSEKQIKENYEPTVKERDQVYQVIKDYIKKRNNIVYGGYAQNKLITEKSQHSGFYGKYDFPDIEFYSSTPIKDAIELCDLLHKQKFKHIMCEEAVHPGTYKLFVNFENYCDITFMDDVLLKNFPTIKLEGMRMTPPNVIYIDSLRVYTDPITSWHRLNKTWSRTVKIMKYYPLALKSNYSTFNFKNTVPENVGTFIRKEILHNHKRVVIGHYAYNYLVKKTSKANLEIKNLPFYQILVLNFKRECQNIFNLFKKKFGKKVSLKESYPFFIFLGRKCEIFYDNKLVLQMYDYNERCTPCRLSNKKKTYFARFGVVIMYILMEYCFAVTYKREYDSNNYALLFKNLITARDNYLECHNYTILDESPFQEFTIECLGLTIDPMRKARLNTIEKLKKGKRLKFRYEPKGKEGKVPNYNFEITTGLPVKSNHNSIK